MNIKYHVHVPKLEVKVNQGDPALDATLQREGEVTCYSSAAHAPLGAVDDYHLAAAAGLAELGPVFHMMALGLFRPEHFVDDAEYLAAGDRLADQSPRPS